MAENNENEQLAQFHIDSEFTLDDTYDHLKDIQKELYENFEKLIINSNNKNNTVKTLLPYVATTSDYVQKKEQNLVEGILKHNHGYDTRIDPILNTIDLYKTSISELEQEIINVQKVYDKLKIDILNKKNNINFLEREKNGIEKMKEACMNAIEKNITGDIVNDAEIVHAKKLFHAVKTDLATVVDIIFPEHIEFKKVLGELTSAYIKGGDQVYIDVNKKFIDCVKFMVEADIATYHRNDKNKIRLVDML